MHYVDRSRLETQHTCARLRYWQYHCRTEEGRGIVPAEDGNDLLFGTAVHAFVEGIATKHNIVDLEPLQALMAKVGGEKTPDDLLRADEWMALYKGLTRTFMLSTHPAILKEFEWIESEKEIEMPLDDDITWMTRLDGVLRRRSDRKFFVLEIKTSAWMEQLLKTSRTNFQLLMEVEALRRSLPPTAEVGGALLLVFNKGRKQKAYKSDGYRRVSPFTYCYSRELADGVQEFSLEYQRTRDWVRTPTWAVQDYYEMASEKWPTEITGQVQLWPSVEFDPDMTASVIRQVIANEERLASFDGRLGQWPELADQLIDRAFIQNFAKCDDFYNGSCQFKEACFSPRVARDPLASGLYVPRTYNHPIERKR